jgi:hypothetical protein
MAQLLESIAERVRNMTQEEFHQSLKNAGIIDDDGNLTPPYVTPKRTRKKKGSTPTDIEPDLD